MFTKEAANAVDGVLLIGESSQQQERRKGENEQYRGVTRFWTSSESDSEDRARHKQLGRENLM